MSRPFANNSAKSAFAQFKESSCASDYTSIKKIKSSFCNPNYGRHSSKNVYSQSNRMFIQKANNILHPCNNINKTQLYINLITKMDLSENIPIIEDLNAKTYPVVIDEYVNRPYLKYNIDPSGNLFGNTVCGINNFENYIVSNLPRQKYMLSK
jgi:hypothetical protein